MVLRINPRWVLAVLVAVNLFLALADLFTLGLDSVIGSDQLRRVFDVDAEKSVPTWFSTIQLFIAFGLVAVIAWIARVEKDRYAIHWALLALIMLALSIDEAAGFHEAGATVMGWLGPGGHWVVLGAVFICAVGLFFLPFLRALPMRYAALFCLAALILISGAVGVESLQLWNVNEALSIRGEYFARVEEFLERIGITVFIFALLLYLCEELGIREVALGVNRATDRARRRRSVAPRSSRLTQQ